MHLHFLIGLLQVVCFTLSAEVMHNPQETGLERSASEGHLNTMQQFQNPQEAGLERSASEGLNNGHLNTKQQFQNPQEAGLERSASEGLNNDTRQFNLNTLEHFLNNLESRMGAVEGEMSTVKGKTSSLEGKVATLGQSRCLSGDLNSAGHHKNDGGTTKTTKSISFSPAFHKTPQVIIAMREYDLGRHAGYATNGENPVLWYTNLSVNKNAFSVQFNAHSSSGGKWYIYGIDWRWMACA